MVRVAGVELVTRINWGINRGCLLLHLWIRRRKMIKKKHCKDCHFLRIVIVIVANNSAVYWRLVNHSHLNHFYPLIHKWQEWAGITFFWVWEQEQESHPKIQERTLESKSQRTCFLVHYIVLRQLKRYKYHLITAAVSDKVVKWTWLER